MPQTARQVVYTPVDIEDGQFNELEIDERLREENAEFERFKEEMHDSQETASITVARQPIDSRGRPVGKKLFQCFECGIDDYTFPQLCSRIRDEFGTGLYRITGRDSGGKYKFGKTIGVQAPTEESKPGDPNSPDVGGLIDKFSDAMERQAARTEEMLTRLAPQNGLGAFEQMTMMMTAMGNMMKGMGIQPQAPQAPRTLLEQLTEMKAVQEMFGGGNNTEAGEANIYSLLGKAVESFGGPIAAALAQGQQSGDLDEHGVATQAALPSPGEQVANDAEELQMQEKQKLYMRKQIHILIQNAKTGIPPQAFALIVVNNTPEDQEEALWEFISAEHCVDQMIALEPAAEPFREWLSDLREEVIKLMSEPEPDDLTETAEDDTNASSDQAVAGVDSETTTSDPHDGDTPIDT